MNASIIFKWISYFKHLLLNNHFIVFIANNIHNKTNGKLELNVILLLLLLQTYYSKILINTQWHLNTLIISSYTVPYIVSYMKFQNFTKLFQFFQYIL